MIKKKKKWTSYKKQKTNNNYNNIEYYTERLGILLCYWVTDVFARVLYRRNNDKLIFYVSLD